MREPNPHVTRVTGGGLPVTVRFTVIEWGPESTDVQAASAQNSTLTVEVWTPAPSCEGRRITSWSSPVLVELMNMFASSTATPVWLHRYQKPPGGRLVIVKSTSASGSVAELVSAVTEAWLAANVTVNAAAGGVTGGVTGGVVGGVVGGEAGGAAGGVVGGGVELLSPPPQATRPSASKNVQAKLCHRPKGTGALDASILPPEVGIAGCY
jgi:hypothetical protein